MSALGIHKTTPTAFLEDRTQCCNWRTEDKNAVQSIFWNAACVSHSQRNDCTTEIICSQNNKLKIVYDNNLRQTMHVVYRVIIIHYIRNIFIRRCNQQIRISWSYAHRVTGFARMLTTHYYEYMIKCAVE